MESNNSSYNKNKKYHNKYYYKNNNHKNNEFYYYKKNNKEKDQEIVNSEQDNNTIINDIVKQKNQIIEHEQVINSNQVDNTIEENQVVEPQIIREEKPKIVQVLKEDSGDYEEFEFRPIKKGERLDSNHKIGFFKYAIGFVILVVLVFGVSYSFFTYRREDSRQGDITSGEVYVNLVEQAVSLSLNKMYPRTTTEARSRTDNYIDFTVKAKNTSETKEIKYSLNINNGEDVSGKTRINPQYLVVDLEEKVNNTYTYIKEAVPLSSFSFSDIVPVNTTSEITKEYRLRIWVSDAIIISDTETNRTYTQAEFANLYANIHVEINSNDQDRTPTGTEKVLAAIESKKTAQTNSCNPVFIDDNGTANDESDDITYFSGTNECVDMNYVWYSGKLWRITAIYPDGAMKLVTEDNITTIFWGSDVEYDGSWVYQWLNEDFYDTLVNPSNIIDNTSTWNYSEDGNSTPVRPETIATQKTKVAPVGLLNAYEYYNAYRNASTSTNYLNIGYIWWLITPYSTSYVRGVGHNGYPTISDGAPASSSYGVRPSINLKSGLEFTGEGTKTSPYKIKEDKEDAVNNTTLLSSRSIGEYVKFDNDLYRIVDTSSGITKLTRLDYLRDSDTVITKNFASTSYFGKSTNTQTDTYWDYYLNNTWYNSISTTYKNMLVDGTYYLGLYPTNTNYKATMCKDVTLDSVTTSDCTKYTSSDTDKTFIGKVGLSRVGEMFSSQLGSGYITSSAMWTITPYSTSVVRYVHSGGILNGYAPASSSSVVRPSITLKSGIKITGGTGYVGGETNSPFEISE